MCPILTGIPSKQLDVDGCREGLLDRVRFIGGGGRESRPEPQMWTDTLYRRSSLGIQRQPGAW